MTRLHAAAAAFFLLAAAPLAALAAPDPFPGCDGFVHPDPKGDGMTGMSLLGLKLTGTIQIKVPTERGAAGVASCDTALADPRQKPEFWIRRVSLLHARAIHHLEAGDIPGALADLDLAKAAAQDPGELFYRRSLGLDLQLTRAYALRSSGDAATAETLALQAWRERPWNLELVTGSLGAMGPAGLEPRNLALLHGFGQLQPRSLDFFFMRAFATGHWDEAAALFPQLASPRTRGRYYDGNEYDYLDPLVVEPFWAKRSGAMAVALMALGRADEAQAVMAAARKRMEDATRDPPPPPETPTGNMANKRSFRYVAPDRDDLLKARQAREEYDKKIAYNHRLLAAVSRSLDSWQGVVDKLAQTRTAPAGPVLDSVRATPAMDPGIAMATLDILLARADLGALRPQVEAEKARRAAPSISRELDISARDLFGLLPDAETAALVGPLRSKGLFNENGFSVGPAKRTLDDLPAEPGVLVAAFRGKDSPKAMVEELALLKAAEAVRASGFHGFIILDRSDTQYIYGEAGSTGGVPQGWESKLFILPVDPANLPAKYRGTPWRVIDADAVWSALSPVYLAPKP